MKKVISILLSLAMILGIMVVSVSAVDDLEYIDARNLTEYGQEHYYIGDATTTPPTVDGMVISGEYSLTVETTMDEYVLRDNEWDRIGNQPLQVSGITYHFSYDADYLYIASEVVDEEAVPYGYFYGNAEGSTNKLRGDIMYFALCGVKDTGAPDTLGARLDMGLYLESDKLAFSNDKQYSVWVREVDKAQQLIRGNTPTDLTIYAEDWAIARNEATKVTTYELVLKRSAFQELFPEYQEDGAIRDDMFAASFWFQDSSTEICSTENGGNGKESGKQLWYWGKTGEEVDAAYSALFDYWFSDGGFYIENGGPAVLPHMVFLGNEGDFDELLTTAPVWDYEEPDYEDEPVDDEPTVEEPADDEFTDEEPTDTDAPADDTAGDHPDDVPTDDDKADDDKTVEGGCGASVTAMGLALVATLGLGVTVLRKKN